MNIALSSLLATPTNASINHAIFYSRLSNFLVRVTPKIPDKTLSLIWVILLRKISLRGGVGGGGLNRGTTVPLKKH